MEKDNNIKTVKIFSWASFFNDLGAEMAYPILPIFMREVLKANMTAVGIIDGLAESTISLTHVFFGYLSDKIKKRKIFIWLGYLISGLARIGYAFSFHWKILAGFRVLNNVGKIREAPRDATVADISLDHNRGKHFGILRMMDNLGAFLGILICILFFGYLGYRKLFLLAAIPSLISALLVLLLIKEKPYLYIKDKDNFHFDKLSSNYKKFLIASIIFSLGSFSYSFLLIFIKESGVRESFIPIIYLIFALFASLFSIPFGKLADRIGRKAVLIISFLLWGLVCLMFIFFKSPLIFLMAFVVYGLHKGAIEPAERAFVSELSPVEYKSSGLGLYKTATGLCALPSALIAGLLWDKINKLLPFYLGLLLTIISLILLTIIKVKK